MLVTMSSILCTTRSSRKATTAVVAFALSPLGGQSHCSRTRLSRATTPVFFNCQLGRSIDRTRRYQHYLTSPMDEENETIVSPEEASKTVESTWNIPGLKSELQRNILRSHKKISKANEKLKSAQDDVDRLTSDDNASLEDLEKCADTDSLKKDLEELQQRLQKLNQLEELLASVKKKETILPEKIALLALDLDVNDAPPRRSPRGPGKKKGPRKQESSRLPYRRYFSIGNTEIRVGKQAEDNDQLTLSPKYRDGADWWMHASGCPGSHVVIRSHAENLDKEVIMDAAALAARHSKCQGSTIKVSLTRCREIRKPPGAKAGLVQLVGRVQTIAINMKDAQERLQRLDKTVLVN